VAYLTDALNAIRKGKVEAQVSIGTSVSQVVYKSTEAAIDCLKLVERDLQAASRAQTLILKAALEPAVEITVKPSGA